MGIDYDAELIFGDILPSFDEEIMKNIKAFDDKFNWDEDKEDDLDLIYYEELVNSWLKNKYANWQFVSYSPYYDCPCYDRQYILTYKLPKTMSITQLKSIMEKIKIEEFTDIWEIMTGNRNVVPKIQAVPHIW